MNTWLNGVVLPFEEGAEVSRQVYGVVPAFENAHMGVWALAKATMTGFFVGFDSSGPHRTAQWWLSAESDADANS